MTTPTRPPLEEMRARAEHEPPIACPYCEERGNDEDCDACETFTCVRCRRRVSWDEGADDEGRDVCDACFVASVTYDPPAADIRAALGGGR